MWKRRAWNKSYARILRVHWYLRVEIPLDLHYQIHQAVDGIPVPDKESVNYAVGQLIELERVGMIGRFDTIKDRLEIAILLFSDLDPDTTAALTQQYDAICKL